MQIYETYEQLLKGVENTGLPVRVLGCTPDGSPLIVVRAGGDRTPAIFLTAGSHSTEHAGVSAVMALIEELDTEHQVYVIPTRDPIGLNGYSYALGLGLGGEPNCSSFDEVEDILRQGGEVTYDVDGIVLSLIGDYGYASCRPGEDRPHPQWAGYHKLQELARERPAALEPFRGDGCT